MRASVRANPVLEELADPSRRSILGLLRGGPRSVNDLVDATGLKQPNVSNHLARLREKGLVEATREGRRMIYRLAAGAVDTVMAASIAVPTDAERPDEDRVKGWAERVFAAIVEGDLASARAAVRDALEGGLPLVGLYQDVFQPALERVGAWYQRGNLSVADEHLATNLVERLMAWASAASPSEPRRARRAVVGAAAGNQHDVGLRMIADSLVQRGWGVSYLGADVPTDDFLHRVAADEPDLVLVGCATESSAASAKELVARLAAWRSERRTAMRIGLGGQYVNAHPEFAESSGADLCPASLRDLLSALGEI